MMEKRAQELIMVRGLRRQMDQKAAGTAAATTCASMYRSRPNILKKKKN